MSRYTFFIFVRFPRTTMKISEHNLAVWQGCNKQFVSCSYQRILLQQRCLRFAFGRRYSARILAGTRLPFLK